MPNLVNFKIDLSRKKRKACQASYTEDGGQSLNQCKNIHLLREWAQAISSNQTSDKPTIWMHAHQQLNRAATIIGH